MAAAGGAGASQAVEPSAGSASSDAGAASSSGESGGRGGAGNNGGSSPSAGNAGTVSVAGAGGAYDLAGGLQILDLPKCDGVDAQACNGACVGLDAELNGCLFLTGGSVFSDMASDADGTFFAIREGSAASITTLDPELGEMTQVLRKLGSNLAFDLSLTSQDLFYVAALNYGAENALWRLPRSGGTATLLLDGLPHVSTFAASERQLFLQEYSAAKLHRFELDGTGDTVFMRSTTALAADGNDLYFLERDSNAQGHLYRAVSGDVEGAELIGDIAAGQIKGFADDWVYVTGTVEGEATRQVYRFKKTGGARESMLTVGTSMATAIAQGKLLYAETDSTREFVNIRDIAASRRTIVGYLPWSAQLPVITYLAMDQHFVYATKGFTLARFRR